MAMATDRARIDALKRKYGTRVVDNAAALHGEDLDALFGWADELDQAYAKLVLDFTYGGMFTRGVLDDRTRTLVVVGQMVAMDEMEELPIHIRAALSHGAGAREVFEVILQTAVYLGYSKARRAARVFKRVLSDLGRLDEITQSQLPVDGGRSQRTLADERPHWQIDVDAAPELAGLLDKYGWRRLSPGLRLQPTHHVQSVSRMDRVDQNFNALWLDYIYSGMYARGILDDRTRILCVVGELYVMGDVVQGENHIRNALAQGATPREVLEVILQSTIYAGMPRFVRFVALLEKILGEQGRLHEITGTQLPLPEART
jgi:alkylhydroperoxidase/carboxymuconolactone decarboxylase family protein YurZ